MSALWLDVTAGASGDMLLGALLGAGADLAAVRDALDRLGVGPLGVNIEPVTRAGLAATRAVVDVDTEPDPPHRGLAQVLAALDAAGLAAGVDALARDTFTRLARAEAAVHGVAVDQVAFHEVGARDALADVVGVAAALADLAPDWVGASAVTLGTGAVAGAHGVLAVPVPAVLALLAEVGAPVSGAGPAGTVSGEACTPTGAALLAAAVTRFGPLPPGRLRGVGVGAGARDDPAQANVVRAVVLDPTDATDGAADGDRGAPTRSPAVVLEATVDDTDPRLLPGVLAALLAAGAADAWLVPVLMKKGRPGHVVAALADEAHRDAVRTVLLTTCSTIGCRETTVTKSALARSERVVDVAGGQVRVKDAWLDGRLVNTSVEHADVAALAAAGGRSEKEVLAAAQAAAAPTGQGG